MRHLEHIVIGLAAVGVVAYVPAPPAGYREENGYRPIEQSDVSVQSVEPVEGLRVIYEHDAEWNLQPREVYSVMDELVGRQTCSDSCSNALMGLRGTSQEASIRRQCSDFMTSTIFVTPRIISLVPPNTVFQARDVQMQPATTSSTCVYSSTTIANTYRGPRPSYQPACGMDSALYSTGCSCLGYPPGSKVVTAAAVVTTTVTQAPPVCLYGLDWAFYKFGASGFPQNPSSGDGCYGLFTQTVLDYIRTTTPTGKGKTNRIGGADSSTGNLVYPITTTPNGVSVYGTQFTPGDSGNWVVEHTGYVHVGATGTYTFTASTSLDLVLFWFNQTAVSGWNAFNYKIRRAKCQNGNAATVFTFAATASMLNQLIPFRIIAVKAAASSTVGAYVWDFTITSPSATILDNTARANNPEILRFCYDCVRCGPIAPPFMEWQPVT